MPFAVTRMDMEIIILSKSNREKQTSYEFTHLWNLILKKWYKWTYLQNFNRLTDIENTLMVTKGEMWQGGINQETGINIYTLLYIRLEKEIATNSCILAWKIPCTEEPGGLQSIVLQSQTRLKRLSTYIR